MLLPIIFHHHLLFCVMVLFQATDLNGQCPNIGCGVFLASMRARHGYRATKIKWGYTTTANVLGDFDYATVEHAPLRVSSNRPAGRNRRSSNVPVGNSNLLWTKAWRLYKCRTCGFLTHALKPGVTLAATTPSASARSSPTPPTPLSRRDAQVAIVMNLLVNVDGGPADYTGSGLVCTKITSGDNTSARLRYDCL